MKKHRKILLAFGCFVGFIVIFLLMPSNDGEGPVHNGKHLSEWMEMLDQEPEPPEAKQAIIAIGTNAYPSLIAWLKEGPATSRTDKLPALIQRFTPKYGVLYRLAMPRRERKKEMLYEAFSLLSTNPSPYAVQELARMTGNPTNSAASMASLYLMQCKCAAASELARIIGNPMHPAHSEVVGFLYPRDFEACSEILVPPLIGCFTSSSDDEAARAAQHLGEIGASPEIAVPALAALMRDASRPKAAAAAAWALSKFGDAAFPCVTGALADPNFPHRAELVRAIAARRWARDLWLPVIATALNDADPEVRREAQRAVQRLAPSASTNSLAP